MGPKRARQPPPEQARVCLTSSRSPFVLGVSEAPKPVPPLLPPKRVKGEKPRGTSDSLYPPLLGALLEGALLHREGAVDAFSGETCVLTSRTPER